MLAGGGGRRRGGGYRSPYRLHGGLEIGQCGGKVATLESRLRRLRLPACFAHEIGNVGELRSARGLSYSLQLLQRAACGFDLGAGVLLYGRVSMSRWRQHGHRLRVLVQAAAAGSHRQSQYEEAHPN